MGPDGLVLQQPVTLCSYSRNKEKKNHSFCEGQCFSVDHKTVEMLWEAGAGVNRSFLADGLTTFVEASHFISHLVLELLQTNFPCPALLFNYGTTSRVFLRVVFMYSGGFS